MATFYAARGVNFVNRYVSAVDGGEPGISGAAWGQIFAIVVTTAVSSGASSYIAQRGGGFVSADGYRFFLQSRSIQGHLYGGGAGLRAIPSPLVGDADEGKVLLLCIQQLSSGAIRTFIGRTQIGSESSPIVYSPASGVVDAIGAGEVQGSSARHDVIGRASFSGELALSDWLTFCDDVMSAGNLPADLAAYGVTMRHRYSVRDDSVGGTIIPATLNDSGTPGGSNFSRSGTLSLVSHAGPELSWGNGAEETWVAFGDSIAYGTGLTADLPAEYPADSSRVGELWEWRSGNWLQLNSTDRYGVGNMLAWQRSVLTGKAIGYVSGGASGTTAQNWVDDAAGVRTACVTAVNAALARNPQAKLRFVMSLGTNGSTVSEPPDLTAQTDSIITSLLNAITPQSAIPDEVHVFAYVMQPTNNQAQPHTAMRNMQIARGDTTTTVGARTVYWHPVLLEDGQLADLIHPNMDGYVQWSGDAAEVATDLDLREGALAAGDPTDADLDAEDRRTRTEVVESVTLRVGERVAVPGIGDVTVLGPGRGRDWFLAGWSEPGGVLAYGSFTVAQIVAT